MVCGPICTLLGCFVLSSGPQRLCGRSAPTVPARNPCLLLLCRVGAAAPNSASPFSSQPARGQHQLSVSAWILYLLFNLNQALLYSPLVSPTLFPSHEFFQHFPSRLRPRPAPRVPAGTHEPRRLLRRHVPASPALHAPGIGHSELESRRPPRRSLTCRLTESRSNSLL